MLYNTPLETDKIANRLQIQIIYLDSNGRTGTLYNDHYTDQAPNHAVSFTASLMISLVAFGTPPASLKLLAKAEAAN